MVCCFFVLVSLVVLVLLDCLACLVIRYLVVTLFLLYSEQVL